MHIKISDESQLVTELEQAIFSYIDLSAMYETRPTVLGFCQFLKESYE